MTSRFEKYIENNNLPILIVHGDDCTISIILSENDVNRVKLCSYDVYEKLIEPSPELQWYTTRLDTQGGVIIVRAVKNMLNIPHINHNEDAVHSLFDLDNIMDHSNEVTVFYGMITDIIKVLK